MRYCESKPHHKPIKQVWSSTDVISNSNHSLEVISIDNGDPNLTPEMSPLHHHVTS
jgi:hypothetical protein